MAFWHDLPQRIHSGFYTNWVAAQDCADRDTRSNDVYVFKVMTYGKVLTLDFENQRRLQP